MHATALICTAVLGLLLFGLGLAVSVLRLRAKQLTGLPSDPSNLLRRVARAHGNTAEYAPLLAVLFLWLGAHQPGTAVLWLMAAATACRLLVVVGIVGWPPLDRPNPLRFTGALGTYLAGIALSLALLA